MKNQDPIVSCQKTKTFPAQGNRVNLLVSSQTSVVSHGLKEDRFAMVVLKWHVQELWVHTHTKRNTCTGGVPAEKN